MGAILTVGFVYFDGLKFITSPIPTASDATNTQKGIIKLAGDLGGTADSPLVVGIQGRPISNTAPTSGQVLGWNGSTWGPTSSSVSDATSSLKGILKLSSDLGGTADLPLVVKINGTSVAASPSTNNVLVATSSTTSSWSTIVDANISNSAAISGSKINPNFGTQALVAGTATISTLTNPAQSGDIRTSNNTTILTARNVLNNADIPIIATDNTNGLTIGDNIITNAVQILSNSDINVFGNNTTSLSSSTYEITVDNTVGLTVACPNIQFPAVQSSPSINQDDTNGSAQDLTIRAQNATGVTSTGGSLILKSGTGTSVNGNVKFYSGTTALGTISLGTSTTLALTSDAGANGIRLIANGSSNTVNLQATGTSGTISLDAASSINFRDSTNATAASITPNSTGTTTLQFATGVTSSVINQADKATAFATGTALTIQAQNTTGLTSTGGSVVLQSGTGTLINGNISFKSGTTTLGTMNVASSIWSILASGSVNGITMAATGASNTIKLQAVGASGTVSLDANSSINFRDSTSATAMSISPASTGTTTLQFATGVTTANINQADKTTASGTGASLTIQAQNETGTTSTGGDLILSPGTGTSTNGIINFNNLSTTNTAPAAGGAAALPATPAGYVSVKINGTTRQIAFY